MASKQNTLTRKQIHTLIVTAAAIQTAISNIERGGLESARHALHVYKINASKGRTIDAPLYPIVEAYVDGDTSQATCLRALREELRKIDSTLREALA